MSDITTVPVMFVYERNNALSKTLNNENPPTMFVTEAASLSVDESAVPVPVDAAPVPVLVPVVRVFVV